MPAPGKEKIPRTEELISKITEMVYGGAKIMDIAKELKLSRGFVYSVYNKAEIQGHMKRHMQMAISHRARELVDALFEQVHEGNVQAIKIGFQVMGALDQEQLNVGKGEAHITVVLPGAAPAKREVEVENDSA